MITTMAKEESILSECAEINTIQYYGHAVKRKS